MKKIEVFGSCKMHGKQQLALSKVVGGWVCPGCVLARFYIKKITNELRLQCERIVRPTKEYLQRKQKLEKPNDKTRTRNYS